jgi:hypothetical protein
MLYRKGTGTCKPFTLGEDRNAPFAHDADDALPARDGVVSERAVAASEGITGWV